MPNFVIENISLPPEVEEALDKRTSMGIVSSGTVGSMASFQQFQAGQAMEAAADGGGERRRRDRHGARAVGRQRDSAARPAGARPAARAAPASGPPPLPGWYLGNGGAQTGPYDDAALAGQVAAGTLTPRHAHLARRAWPAWEPASSVPDVAKHLGATPPPLPPQA